MRKHAPFSAIATCLLFAFVHAAGACSLSDRQITVNFDEGSAGLGARNARVLAEWFIQWRDGLGIESIIAAAPAVKRQRQLAEERLRHVARLLHGLNTGNAPISYEVEDRPVGFSEKRYSNSLDLNVQPACISSGTCCRHESP